MSNDNSEILKELKGINQELHNINEKLEDLSYLRHLEEINQSLVELNPSYQKTVKFRQKFTELRSLLIDEHLSTDEAEKEFNKIYEDFLS